jgi:tRNA dimethylallyltransferase
MKRTPILAGPTAAGKTQFALEVASELNLEIINADSLNVYRGFNIGTAKPSTSERASVPHHLIDIRDPLEKFTAADFVREVHALCSSRRALIVGGTHFYLKALCLGLWDAPPTQPEYRNSLMSVETSELFEKLLKRDPDQALKVGRQDRYRIIRALEILEFSDKIPSLLESQAKSKALEQGPDPRFALFWIDRDNTELNERIALRTRQMIEQGLIDETRELLARFPGARALHSVGYRQVAAHLSGTPPPGRKLRPGIEGLEDEIRLATRQLVKAQRTFLRSLSFAERFLFDADRPKLRQKIERCMGS